MRYKLLFFISLLYISANSFAQLRSITPNAEISVLTIESGASLNDAFGHSAFRIKDSIANIDVIFDYGRYNFDAPNFYLNFARGKLEYKIGSNQFDDFYRYYVNQNRGIKAQLLNLSFEEKKQLYAFLIRNNRPENRSYLYDFFYDNCATKIKDVVVNATDNTVTFYSPSNLESESFRSLIYENVKPNSWGAFGIDLALGSVIDRAIAPENYMFLPEYIFHFFDAAQLKNNAPLVKETKVLFKSNPVKKKASFFISPLFVLCLISLFIIYRTYKDYKAKQRSKIFDAILFSITGLIGIVILLLWFATDHTATANNYNLLWAFFLNIFMLKQLFKPSLWFKKYIKFLIILLCLMTLHWILGVQVFNIALLPLLIALFIRYIYMVSSLEAK